LFFPLTFACNYLLFIAVSAGPHQHLLPFVDLLYQIKNAYMWGFTVEPGVITIITNAAGQIV